MIGELIDLAVDTAFGAVGGLLVLVPAWFLWLRRANDVALPAFLIGSRRPSRELRELVAKMARSAAKDVVQEWDTIPPGLKEALLKEIKDQTRKYVAAGFAAHVDRRRPQ